MQPDHIPIHRFDRKHGQVLRESGSSFRDYSGDAATPTSTPEPLRPLDVATLTHFPLSIYLVFSVFDGL